MEFILDKNLADSTIKITDLELSSLLLKNDASYPWFILVPRVLNLNQNNITEIYQLNKKQQSILTSEIATISEIISNIYKPDKLNIGSLGNIVPQLHVHIIARFKSDKTWPHSVWQPDQQAIEYSLTKISEISKNLISKFNLKFNLI